MKNTKSRMQKIMQKNINSFLQLGYFLDYKNPDLSFDFSGVDKEKYVGATEQELIEEGSKLWLEAISANFKPNEKHLVPISGGLDSRAVLAGLLKHTDAQNIHTYTFGTPKTLDYEIGSYVAKKVCSKHTSFDLTQYQYTQEELEDISTRIDRQTILFHHPPVWQLDKRFKELQLWSGFMGDPIAGSKLDTSLSKDEEINKYLKSNLYTKSLIFRELNELAEVVEPAILDSKILTPLEEIDFINRQLKFIAPHVLMEGFDYKLPFLNEVFFDFMLSIPNKYREGQYLYKKILLHTFPKEFSWKTKTNFGLPLKASKQRVFINRVKDKVVRVMGVTGVNVNYLDFNQKIRSKPDLRNIISLNIHDLKDRNVIDWLDPVKILNTHLAGKGNHADALIVLASLEIHLKSGLKL